MSNNRQNMTGKKWLPVVYCTPDQTCSESQKVKSSQSHDFDFENFA